MAAFRMGKLTTMPAGLIYASVNVHLAKEEEPKKQLVRPEQLPIYTAPPLHSKYVEEQPGYLQMGFASIRTTAVRYVGWCKGVYIFMKNGIVDTVQFGKDAYVYLKNPPQDFFPKLGVITASGLAGLVTARKGSRFKKIAYPLGLASLGATVCYPAQSVIIAKITGKKAYTTSQQIYQAIKSLWTKSSEKESLPEPKEGTKAGRSDGIHAKTPDSRHSVSFPKERASATKVKSESTAGSYGDQQAREKLVQWTELNRYKPPAQANILGGYGWCLSGAHLFMMVLDGYAIPKYMDGAL